jgi:hypothetical protein
VALKCGFQNFQIAKRRAQTQPGIAKKFHAKQSSKDLYAGLLPFLKMPIHQTSY